MQNKLKEPDLFKTQQINDLQVNRINGYLSF